MQARTLRRRAQSESVEDVDSKPPPSSFPAGLRLLDHPVYAHTSIFKSSELKITINSPSVRILRRPEQPAVSLPVFGDHDHVMGSVTLDPQNCAADSGRLTISVEGAFEYISPMSATKAGPSQITPGKHRYVFYQDSAVIPLYTASEPPSRPTFRSAITATLRRTVSAERLPSLTRTPSRTSMHSRTHSGLNSPPASASPKTFNFDFALPKSEKIGDELPPTFSVSNVVSGGVRGRVYAENADVKYRIIALWEALDGSTAQAKLDTQILFQPDTDFQSLDGFSAQPESWSETALSKSKGLPVECAITIPSPATFPRSASIPYFVVFTTKPRSRTLSAEFMADATIAVSLVRRVSFPKSSPQILPPLQTQFATTTSDLFSPVPSSSSSSQPSSPCSSPRERGRTRLFKRVVRSAPPILSTFRLSRADPDVGNDPHASLWANEKPLPSLPPSTDNTTPSPSSAALMLDAHRLSDSRTLHTDVSVGFPKRPKGRMTSPQSHPSLESVTALPDGLYKGCIPLQKGWFPTLQWHGLDVEYYLQVSVIFDSNEYTARIPLRIY